MSTCSSTTPPTFPKAYLPSQHPPAPPSPSSSPSPVLYSRLSNGSLNAPSPTNSRSSFHGVSFLLQIGLTRETVNLEPNDLSLSAVKDLVCSIVDQKVSSCLCASHQCITLSTPQPTSTHTHTHCTETFIYCMCVFCWTIISLFPFQSHFPLRICLLGYTVQYVVILAFSLIPVEFLQNQHCSLMRLLRFSVVREGYIQYHLKRNIPCPAPCPLYVTWPKCSWTRADITYVVKGKQRSGFF